MKLKNETEYRATLQRIEELLKLVGNDTPIDDPNLIDFEGFLQGCRNLLDSAVLSGRLP